MVCEFTGLEYLLNPCAQLDTPLYPGLDLEVVSSLEYEYSVTRSPPGDYSYIKWWDGGKYFQAELCGRRKWKLSSGA